MNSHEVNPDQFGRYLRLIGLERSQPDYDTLCRALLAQMVLVPFENISKLYRLKHQGLRGLPNLEAHLNGIEKYHFGGTCYANNYYFHLLLRYLGFDVRLCGADMSTPDAHMVSIVRLDSRDLLIDVGYGAPFLTPLPLDLLADVTVTNGHDRYVLRPKDSLGKSRLDLYRKGKLKHGYTANPGPRTLEDFSHSITESYRPEATFLNAILLVRFYPGRTVAVHNQTVIEAEGGRVRVRMIPDRAGIAPVVEELFGIPKSIVGEAVDMIGEFGDAWG
ncbi:MAG TPA: arylamine N-acetyltransferase [Candidatus Acidoferrum sp.]|nr:arylamine N-acetyltransferase [Candidatus Acidoferrum sp.]